MPELPEVERAAALVRSVAAGRRIEKVETSEDTIVFDGVTHDEFAKEITGRSVKTAARYGKVFYVELEGIGKFPVLHFGMTGRLQIRGQKTINYRSNGTHKSESDAWPPRFMKFILHLSPSTASEAATELAFTDARRLARIRLCARPLEEPPISELGFDPILCMPTLEIFTELVSRRSCPIKALLLNQSFSAGVGNWVADEILYHARVHPEQRCNALVAAQISALYEATEKVCQIAVACNADDTKYPENWLFKHRWGKGKKAEHTLKLPSGELATIKWLTVGGRTSAYVVELQKLPSRESNDVVVQSTSSSDARGKEDLSSNSIKTPEPRMLDGESNDETVAAITRKTRRKAAEQDTSRSAKRTRSSATKQ